MNIRQFQKQYEALKVLSVQRQMMKKEEFLTLKKRSVFVSNYYPSQWLEIVAYLKQDLVEDFNKSFLDNARNYSNEELQILFDLLEHNQELLKDKDFVKDLFILSKELMANPDTGWTGEIEEMLMSRNVTQLLLMGTATLKIPFANLMAEKVKYAFDSLAYSYNYRIFIDWLPKLQDKQPNAISQVKLALEKIKPTVNLRVSENKRLYNLYGQM